jgi:hypothetical protein
MRSRNSPRTRSHDGSISFARLTIGTGGDFGGSVPCARSGIASNGESATSGANTDDANEQRSMCRD